MSLCTSTEVSSTLCGSPLVPLSFSTYCSSNGQSFNACASTTSTDTINVTPNLLGMCYWCGESTSNSSASPTTPVASPSGPTITHGSISLFKTNSDITTLSPTTSNSTTTTSANSSLTGGVGKKAAAGIGIGCALVGALLAGLIAFLLFLRKHRQANYQKQRLPPNGGGYVEQEKCDAAATRTHVRSGLVTNIDRLLPQPAEDGVIIGGLSKIRDAIKNHVQNYYHDAPIGPRIVDEARLVELATVMAVPTSGIVDLFLNPATRMPMIRLFLAHLILSRCSEKTDGTASFLPNEVSALTALHIDGSDTVAAQAALFSKWKTITGTLIQQRYSQQPDENDPRAGSISQALAAAEPILHPFINPSVDMNARHRNLEGIIRRAAQYAFLMFCQPGSFSFDYTGTGQPASLVVFPALLQTVSDEAEVLSPPRVLSEKEVVVA